MRRPLPCQILSTFRLSFWRCTLLKNSLQNPAYQPLSLILSSEDSG